MIVHYEVFLPVIFIIFFMLLLFLIYAINNLDLKSKICSNGCCFCPSWRRLFYYRPRKGIKRRKFTLQKSEHDQQNHQHQNQTTKENNYYEGPTNGYYRVGNNLGNGNYYSHNFHHFHPPPPVTLIGSTNIKINQIYKSCDGELFELELPTESHVNSNHKIFKSSNDDNLLNRYKNNHLNLQRSFSSNLDTQQQQHFLSKLLSTTTENKNNNTTLNINQEKKIFYFNNINYWPSKIMSEHELKKLINLNYYVDPVHLQQQTTATTTTTMKDQHLQNKVIGSNLFLLRQNFSDIGLLKSANSQPINLIKTGGIRKKVMSTSSNIFSISSTSSYRMSSTADNNIKNHFSPNYSSFSLKQKRKYESEPVKLSQLTYSSSVFKPLGKHFGKQNYLKNIAKLKKISVSMNSLIEKATSNLVNLVKINPKKPSFNSNHNFLINHQTHRHGQVDAAVQTSSILMNCVDKTLHSEKNENISRCTTNSTNTNTTSTNNTTTSTFNSLNTQLIQTNPYGTILANYGSASTMQRSQTARILDREKRKYSGRLRAFSDFNVLSSTSHSPINEAANYRHNLRHDNNTILSQSLSSLSTTTNSEDSSSSTSALNQQPVNSSSTNFHQSISNDVNANPSKLIHLNIEI
jgi:hypothetical protein